MLVVPSQIVSEEKTLSQTVAFFDVGGTLIKTYVWKPIMEYFKENRKRRLTHFAFWGYHIPLYLFHKAGLISQDRFRGVWGAHLSWYFRGYSIEEANEIWDWTVGNYLADDWRLDTLQALRKHKQNGDLVTIVSAGPLPLIARIAEEVGADYVVATPHEVKDNVFTGRVTGEVYIGPNKPKYARAKMQELGLDINYSASYAYGDSPGDQGLFELVGNPVAVHPDDILRPIAEKEGWKILD